MAPLELEPHSCVHCQRLVVHRQPRAVRSKASRNLSTLEQIKARGTLFNFTFADLKVAAADDCKLCAWVLDVEYISREQLVAHHAEVSRDGGYRPLSSPFRATAMWTEEYFIPTDPKNTLRREDWSNPGQLNDTLLFAAFYDVRANPLDICGVNFFALWDAQAEALVYRTRRGFKVHATPENFAARHISTMTIEADPGSDRNFQKMTSWLNTCLNEHPNCSKPSKSFMPTRLIEIVESERNWRLRLMRTDGIESVPYAALSYCWGGPQDVQCTSSLIHQWFVAIPSSILPKTIQDSVTVCRRLGIRFLWVDSFCIIQDDPPDKAWEITQMPHIYGNAYLTIAAARASSVNEGFLGRRTKIVSEEEVFELPYRCQNDQNGSIILSRYETRVEPLDERAWTLQERLLSSRTVEFGTLQLSWICQNERSRDHASYTDGWRIHGKHSQGKWDTLNHPIFESKFNVPRGEQPVLDEKLHKSAIKHWYMIVQAYTHRKLTVPTDRLLAISGIAERYGRIFGDTYLAGLWRSSLLSDLLWTAYGKTGSTPRPEKYQGPSWSWVAVNGSVQFPVEVDLSNNGPEFIECSVNLSDNKAPYGSVLGGPSRLVLRARILPAVQRRVLEKISWESEDRVVFTAMNGARGIWEAEMTRDALELDALSGDSSSPSERAVTILELVSETTDNQWLVNGLVLRHVAGQTYSRLGVFNFRGNTMRDCRKNEESDAEWEERVDRDFRWFKDCIPTVVEII